MHLGVAAGEQRRLEPVALAHGVGARGTVLARRLPLPVPPRLAARVGRALGTTWEETALVSHGVQMN